MEYFIIKKEQAKIFFVYLMCLFTLILISNNSNAQVKAVHFNADWNSSNNVDWFDNLGDCETDDMLIEQNNNQDKYKIAIVPTIIIFDDGEEVKRFQADLSFKMAATKNEVQEYIDELLMSKF